MYRDPRHRDAFQATLPVGGQDGGTIARRFKGTRAEGNVKAKTGSIANVRALSGYVTTLDGEPLVFSIIANSFTQPQATIDAATDLAVERLANVDGGTGSNPPRALDPESYVTSGLGVFAVLFGSTGGLMYSGSILPVSTFRKSTICFVCSGVRLLPSWYSAICRTASSSDATPPSWKYGPVFSTFRSDGTLNTDLVGLVLGHLEPPGVRGPRVRLRPRRSSGTCVPPSSAPLWQAWHPVSRNVFRPTSSSGVSAVSSPASSASHRDGVISLRSNAPIALAMLS